MSNQLKGYFYITTITIAWAINYVNTKVLLEIIDSASLGLIRTISIILALVLSSLIFGYSNKALRINIVPLSLHKDFMIIGGIGTALYIYLQNLGINLISPSIAAILIAIIPVLRVLTQHIITKKGFNKYELFLLLFFTLGFILIINPINFLKSEELRGYLYILGAGFASVICFFILKNQKHQFTSITSSFYASLYASLFFLLFILITGEKRPDVSNIMQTKYIAHILFLLISTSSLAFILHIKAINILGFFKSSIIMAFLPIITIIASYIILGESLGAIKIFGGILIIISSTVFSFKQ